jgi:hypothetical protein
MTPEMTSVNSSTRLPTATALRLAFALGFVADLGMFVHAGWINGLIAWAVVGVVGLMLVDKLAVRIARVPDSTQRRLLIGAAIAGAVGVIVLYPLANALIIPGAQERDELILGGLNFLFSGRNPYEFNLGARAPISPFPSWLLLNIPFYLAAKVSPYGALYALQNIAAFAIAYVLWRRVLGTQAPAYLLFLLCISLALPIVVFELISGSDYLADALLASAMASIAIFAPERTANNRWLMVATGAVLISRLHFALLFAPIAGYYLATAGLRETVRRLGWMIVPSALVAVAFWSIDPARFMPLHTSNYLGEWDGKTKFDAALHFNASFVADAALTLGVAGLLTIYCYLRSSAAVTMYSLAAVVGTPILVSFISNSMRRGEIFLGPYSSHFLVVVILVGMAVALSTYDKRSNGGNSRVPSQVSRSAPAQKLA